MPEAAAGATADASLKGRWLTERLSCGEGIISGWGQRVLTLSYAGPVRGGWHTLSVTEAEAKREVGATSEEVKLIEDK